MKQVKQIIGLIFLLIIMSFSACVSGNQESSAPAFPNAQWGGSVEEVLKDLGTSREALGSNLQVTDESTGAATAVVENLEVFGEESVGAILLFGGTQDGKGAFYRAEVYYHDGADMEGVRAEMEKAFGKPAETVNLYGETNGSHALTSDEQNQYWQGPLLQDMLDSDEQIALRQDVTAQRQEFTSGMSDSQWEEYLKNPAIWAGCYTNYQSPLEQYAAEEAAGTAYRNAVILDATLQGEVDRLS